MGLPHLDKMILPFRFFQEAGLKVYRPAVRSTEHARLLECPRRFLFSSVLALRPLGAYLPAFEIGITFHELLRQAYLVENPAIALPQAAATRLRETTERLAADSSSGVLPDGRLLNDVLVEVEKDSKMALAMASEVLRVCPVEDIRRNYTVQALEKPMEATLDIGKRKVRIAGRIDLLLQSRRDQSIWIADYKTCSGSPVQRAEVLPMEFQARLYKLLVASCLPADRVGGVFHTIVRKPTIRQKQNESIDEYVTRVSGWYREQAEKEPNDPPIVQSVVPHAGPLMDDLLASELVQQSRMSNARLNLVKYAPNTAACFGRFGNQRCPYLELCLSPVDRWTGIMQSGFTQQPREEETTE